MSIILETFTSGGNISSSLCVKDSELQTESKKFANGYQLRGPRGWK